MIGRYDNGCNEWLYVKMGDMAAPQKVKPKHLDRPLVADCSIGHKSPGWRHAGGWDVQIASRTFSPKIISVVLGSSHLLQMMSPVQVGSVRIRYISASFLWTRHPSLFTATGCNKTKCYTKDW